LPYENLRKIYILIVPPDPFSCFPFILYIFGVTVDFYIINLSMNPISFNPSYNAINDAKNVRTRLESNAATTLGDDV
jgi:hypothetical protein